MNIIRRWFFTRPLAVYLAFACLIIGSVPSESLAFIISSQTGQQTIFDRQHDLNIMQRVLESKAVSQRLSELGLSMEEINKRINNLTDEELHQFASQIDNIYAGGDSGLGIIISILLIIVLVLTILHLTGHKIIVK